jgi:hypothetical protein
MLDRLAPAHFAPLVALRALDVSNNQLASLDGVEALPNLHALVRGDSLLTALSIRYLGIASLAFETRPRVFGM